VLKRARFCCELCGVSGINGGEAAGQTVFHCHLHLIAAARGLGVRPPLVY
jgi:diadenosine tetraphosphate (Ap4A) HIT family hydrolase